MINIAELLKNASKDLELYSPICGHCKLSCILYNDCIRVIAHDAPFRFDKYGRFCSADNAECLLFPSKDCRTWEGWKLPSKSKFKVGDWIVQNDNGTISQITKTINGKDEHGEYHAYEHTNGYFAACFEDEFHLWTIQDAGNGDVLANTAGCILIVKDNESCLCYIDKNGEFHANNNRWFFANFSDNALMPATKKQRELLLHKMKESGYQWDVDKKELRKIIEPKFKVGDWLVYKDGGTFCGGLKTVQVQTEVCDESCAINHPLDAVANTTSKKGGQEMTRFERILERLLICWHVLTKRNYVFFALDNGAIQFDANGDYSHVDANKLAEFDYFDENFNLCSKYGIKNISWFIWGTIEDFAYKRIIKDIAL